MTLTPPSAAHPLRITEQLEAYWRSIKGDRAMPLEEEINPEALAPIWDYCFLAQVTATDSFAYSYLGSALIEAYGNDLTGHEIVETLIYPHPASLFNTFRTVVATADIAMDENEFTNPQGVRIRYRSCVLPLQRHGGDGVGFVLGGMKWKAY